MKDSSKAFLYQYLNNESPTGFEQSGQQIWLDYLKPYIDTYFTDTYGTAVGVINPNSDYKVVIEAHSDEISWFVNFITEEGFILANNLTRTCAQAEDESRTIKMIRKNRIF